MNILITAAWAKLNEEFGQMDMVGLSKVEALVKPSFKSSHDHEQFQDLYDAGASVKLT